MFASGQSGRTAIFTQDVSGEHELVVPAEGQGPLVMDGVPRGDTWVPPEVRVVSLGDGAQIRKYSDLPFWGTDALVLGARAKAAIEPLIPDIGELLPMHSAERALWLLNVTRIADVLDRLRSGFVRFTDGRVMEISPAVFRADTAIPEIFKLPPDLDKRMYFTNKFIRRIEDAGLEGFSYELAGYADG